MNEEGPAPLFIRLYLDKDVFKSVARETIHRLLRLLNRVTIDEMENQLWWI